MFSSKIAAEGRAQQAAVEMLRDPQQLEQRDGSRLIVDLNQQGALDAAAAWKQRTSKPVIGFVSHVDAATITRARELGIDQVLARSAFVQQLPTLLAQPPQTEPST